MNEQKYFNWDNIKLSRTVNQQSTGSGTVSGTKISDSDFATFIKLLANKVGFKLTDQNIRFLNAWRQAENTKASNNPFATTINYKNDPEMTKFNLANRGQGVKNFSTLEYGVDATAITMKLPYYNSLIQKLQQDNITAMELAKDSSLDKWGTGSAKIQGKLGGGGTTPTDPEQEKTTTTDTEKKKQTTATHNVKRNNESWIISDKKSVYGRLAKVKSNLENITIWKDISDWEDINRFNGKVETSVFNKATTWYAGNTSLTIKDIKFIKIPEIKSRSGKTDKASGKVYSYLYLSGYGWVQSNQVDTLPAKK